MIPEQQGSNGFGFLLFWEVVEKTQQERTEFLISTEVEEPLHKNGTQEAAVSSPPSAPSQLRKLGTGRRTPGLTDREDTKSTYKSKFEANDLRKRLTVRERKIPLCPRISQDIMSAFSSVFYPTVK